MGGEKASSWKWEILGLPVWDLNWEDTRGGRKEEGGGEVWGEGDGRRGGECGGKDFP